METKEENKNKLKKLTISDTSFEANGKKYFIEPEISPERFAKMEELQIELGFGVSYKKMFEAWSDQKEYLNNLNFVDAAVQADNMMNGIAGIEDRRHTILQYCACFINTEDEDRRRFDEKIVAQKIADWEEEGFDYLSFFNLAVNMVSGLKRNYLKFIQDISQ